MIGDMGKQIIIENRPMSKKAANAIFHYDLTPLKKGERVFGNFDLIETDGWYYIKYTKYTKFGQESKTPFIINCDLFSREAIKVKSWKDLTEGNVKTTAETENLDKKIKFILDNTNLDEELFEIAKDNPYTKVPFSLNIQEMVRKIKTGKGMEGQSCSTISMETEDEEGIPEEEVRRRMWRECN